MWVKNFETGTFTILYITYFLQVDQMSTGQQLHIWTVTSADLIPFNTTYCNLLVIHTVYWKYLIYLFHSCAIEQIWKCLNIQRYKHESVKTHLAGKLLQSNRLVVKPLFQPIRKQCGISTAVMLTLGQIWCLDKYWSCRLMNCCLWSRISFMWIDMLLVWYSVSPPP